jgi:hypothetical protein
VLLLPELLQPLLQLSSLPRRLCMLRLQLRFLRKLALLFLSLLCQQLRIHLLQVLLLCGMPTLPVCFGLLMCLLQLLLLLLLSCTELLLWLLRLLAAAWAASAL